MIALVDTHCHLDLFEKIKERVTEEDLLGIKTITVTNAPRFYRPNQDLFRACSNIRVALGFHPQLVQHYKDDLNIFESLIDQTKYIGEIGLDGSKEYQSTYTIQLGIFRGILVALAGTEGKVVTMHSRNAAAEVIELLSKQQARKRNKFILHWFTGTLNELRQAIKIGCYFSVNHKMVSGEKGRRLIEEIPQDRLLTETDAPFTISGGFSSRIKSLETTIQELSLIRKTTPGEMRSTIHENFRSVII